MTKILEVRNASFSYEKSENILEKVNLSVSKGDIYFVF